MSEPITISNETPALTGMDFLALRQQGIELIQQLSGNAWTDYNLHDPGITILEQLCYAITDLSYRLSFDIQDLLSYGDEVPTGAQQFFTARDILSTRPVTLLDYRKLLIDIDGVKNAWLETDPVAFANLYYDQQACILAFKPAENRTPMQLSGLYRVIIEQDENVGEADLPNLVQTVKDKLHAQRNLSEDFSVIEVLPAEAITLKAEIDIDDDADPDTVRARIYLALAQFISPSIRFYSLQERLKAGLMPEDIFSGPVLEHGFLDDKELQNFDRRKVLYRSDIYSLLLDVEGVEAVRNLSLESDKSLAEQQGWVLKLDAGSTPKYKLIGDVFKKDEFSGSDQSEIKLYKKQIVTDLDPNAIKQQYNKLVADELITISAEVDIREHIDPNYVLAKIYQALNQLIKTYNVITNNEKAGFKLLPVIDATVISDLLMNLADIRSVKNVTISSDKNEGGSQLTLEPTSAPRFKLPAKFWTDRDIKLSQASQPATELALDKFEIEVRRLASEQAKKSRKLGYDMPVQQGDYRELNDYISIQTDFPANYGIGQEGLSELVSAERKAQAKQLKAYLLVFDQLLANYFAQLEAAKHMLAVNPGQLGDLNRTYFAQPVAGGIKLAEILTADTDQAALEQLTEDAQDSNRFTRKSRLLDHLLARFAEDFPDNQLIMYTQGAQYNSIKQNYLSDYANTSQNRFTAYNYLAQEPIWNSLNVPGLQRRISQLLGIQDPRRKILSLGYDEGFHLVEHILLRPVDEARLARFPRPITGFKQSVIMDNQLVCYSLQHGLTDGERIELIIPDNPRQTVKVIIDEMAPIETSTNAFKLELEDEELKSELLAFDSNDDYAWDYAQRATNAITAFSASNSDSEHVICTSAGHGLQDQDIIQLICPDATAIGPLTVVMDATSSTNANSFKIIVDNALRDKLLAASETEGYSWNKAVTAFTQSAVDEQQVICRTMQHQLKNGEQIQFILPDVTSSLPFTISLDDTDSTVETSANAFKIRVADETLRAEILALNPAGYGWSKATQAANPRKFPRVISEVSIANHITDFTQSTTDAEQVICQAVDHGLLNGEFIQLIFPDLSQVDELKVVMGETGANHFKLVIADPGLRNSLLTADPTMPYQWTYDVEDMNAYHPITGFTQSETDAEQIICQTTAHALVDGELIQLISPDLNSVGELRVVMDETDANHFKLIIHEQTLKQRLLDADIRKPYCWSYDGSSYLICRTEFDHELQEGDKIRLNALDYQTELAVMTPVSTDEFCIRVKSPEAISALTAVHLQPVTWELVENYLSFIRPVTGISLPVVINASDDSIEVTITTRVAHELEKDETVAIFDAEEFYREYTVADIITPTGFKISETNPETALVNNMPVGTTFYFSKLPASYAISDIHCPDKEPIDIKPVEITLTSSLQALEVGSQVAIYTSYTKYRIYAVTAVQVLLEDPTLMTFTVIETDPDSLLLSDNAVSMNWHWAEATDFSESIKADDAKKIDRIKPKFEVPEEESSVRVVLSSKDHQLQVNDKITVFGAETSANYTVTRVDNDTFTVQESQADSELLQGMVPDTKLNWTVVREKYEPYSFQVSFVFPNWQPRFKDPEFRQLLTETISRETPAHIAINIHWFDRKQMNAFEQVYGNWLLRKLNENSTAGAIDTAANKVLEALYQARALQEYDQEIFGEISQMTVDKDFRISYPNVESVVSSDEVGGIGHMKIRQIGNEEMNTKKHHNIFQILFPED